MDSSDSDGGERESPAEIMEAAKQVSLDSLPNKSRVRYNNIYKRFKQWYKDVNAKVINENLILEYILKVSEKSKPSSLWGHYSMLRSTILIYNNIDIKYPKVIAYLKKQNAGYRRKESKIFERSDIDKYLETANDRDHLMLKVVAIIGIAGACRREELCKLTIDNVEVKDGVLVIKILDTKTKTNIERIFAVAGEKNIEICKKYIALRPTNTKHQKLFLTYRGGKCTVQPVGIQTIGNVPKKIAEFLQLPNPEEYTGHSFRRRRKATKVAESNIADSSQNKMEIANRIQGTVVKRECEPGTSFEEVNAIETDGRIEAGAVTVNEQNNTTTFRLPDIAHSFTLNNCNVTINITNPN